MDVFHIFTLNMSLWLLIVLIIPTIAEFLGIKREYCQEVFHPKCEKHRVIVMHSAIYGRMNIGKCMKKDFGVPSCYNDELHFFDNLCSGKFECRKQIPEIDLTSKLSCLEELSPYLEASYSCQKVVVPEVTRCISPTTVKANKKLNYIASVVSLETSCGMHKSPWVIEAQPGQQLMIGLIDFAWENQSQSLGHNSNCRTSYGYILDLETDDVFNICGGKDREKHIFKSTGNAIQIVLEESNVKNNQFVITFKSLGCPNYNFPSYSWNQHENDTLVIGCQHSQNRWKLRCVDDIWLGIVEDCPPPPPKPSKLPKVVNVAGTKSEHVDETILPSIMGNHVIAFSLLCVTMIICCAVIVLGFHCTKRYELNMLKQKELSKSNMNVMCGTMGQPMTLRTIRGGGTLIPHTNTELPPYTFPFPKDDRPPKLPQRTESITRENAMITSMAESDYLSPQNERDDEENSVLYYVLENPDDSKNMANMSDEMYQSIHLNNSLSSNKP